MHDPTFTDRLVFGLSALALLALADYIKNPKNPTRIKEYGFLFGVAACTIGYGLFHDLVTHAISPEYFFVGKGIPTAENSFSADMVSLALKASWTAGLFVGLVFLVANNPGKRSPQLAYAKLARLLVVPLVASVVTAVVLGLIAVVTEGSIIEAFQLRSLALQNTTAFVAVSGTRAGLALVAFFY